MYSLQNCGRSRCGHSSETVKESEQMRAGMQQLLLHKEE
jgi:hypothetical protein